MNAIRIEVAAGMSPHCRMLGRAARKPVEPGRQFDKMETSDGRDRVFVRSTFTVLDNPKRDCRSANPRWPYGRKPKKNKSDQSTGGSSRGDEEIRAIGRWNRSAEQTADSNDLSCPLESTSQNRRTPFLVCGFLLLAVVAVFGQTVSHDFINFDDDLYVTRIFTSCGA